MPNQIIIRTSAKAKVMIEKGGSTYVTLDARVPTSQESSRVIINLTLGASASVIVHAQEPPRKAKRPAQKKSTRHVPQLLGPP